MNNSKKTFTEMQNATTSSKRARSSDLSIDNEVIADVGTNIFLNDSFADLHFSFGEADDCQQRIPAHKAILAAASNVFATMLNGEWKEQNEVQIVDATFDAFKDFLQFFYLSKVTVSMENIWEIINLANKYNIRRIMDQCEPLIIHQTTVDDDLCRILDLSLQFNLSKLKDRCLKKIGEDTTKVLKTKGFLDCSKYALKCMLEELHTVDCCEMVIFEACLMWATHVCLRQRKDSSNFKILRDELGDCLYAIRFGSMESKQISFCISNNPGLFNKSELEDLWLSIGVNKSKIKLFKNTAKRQEHAYPYLRMEVCDLRVPTTHRVRLQPIESTTFNSNKTLSFEGISVQRLQYEFSYRKDNTADAELLVFECNSNEDGRTQVLKQKVRLDVRWKEANLQKYLKFNNSILVHPNKEYDVRILVKIPSPYLFYFNRSVGRNTQKSFGDGIILSTTSKCSDFINMFHFYPTDDTVQ